MVVTVTDKGQLTVPKPIRDQLDIRPGTKLDFEAQPDGRVLIRVLKRGADNLFGLLQQRGARARTVEEMDAGVATAVSDRARRSKD